MSNVQFGVMHPSGHVAPIPGGPGVEHNATEIARSWGGTVVTRTATYSAWTDEPSPCPRCTLPVWPSGLGALHADGQTDCTAHAPRNDEVDR